MKNILVALFLVLGVSFFDEAKAEPLTITVYDGGFRHIEHFLHTDENLSVGISLAQNHTLAFTWQNFTSPANYTPYFWEWILGDELGYNLNGGFYGTLEPSSLTLWQPQVADTYLQTSSGRMWNYDGETWRDNSAVTVTITKINDRVQNVYVYETTTVESTVNVYNQTTVYNETTVYAQSTIYSQATVLSSVNYYHRSTVYHQTTVQATLPDDVLRDGDIIYPTIILRTLRVE